MNKRLFKERIQGSLAVVLAFALILTNMNMTAFAAEPQSTGNDQKIITKVKEPDSSVLSQTLSVGAEESDIQFPESLTVAVTKEPENETPAEPETEKETVPETEQSSEEKTPEEVTEEPEETEEKSSETEQTESTETEEKSSETEQTESPEPEEKSSETEQTEATETEANAAPETESVQTTEAEQKAIETESAEATETEKSVAEQLFGWLAPVTVYAAELNEKEESIAVTWKLDESASTSEAFDASKAGNTYVYIPVIPGEYTVAEGVELPKITVTIGTDKERSEVIKALQSRINALPTVDEFIALADGATVEDSTLNQAQLDVYNEAQAIADEMDKLTDEDQAQLDTEKLEKLFEYFNGQVEESDIASGDGWNLSSDGVLRITDAEVLNQDYSKESAPWHKQYYNIKSVEIEEAEKNKVKRIGDYAFYDCWRINSIEIPEGVTSIGVHAFDACSSLSSIKIPEGVTSIGRYAFSYCDISSIKIPKGVTSIEEGVFYPCSKLSSIEIHDNVTSIGDFAFRGCSSLSSIKIPDSVTSIGSGAFESCSNLSSIEIPNSVTSIGSIAFESCSSLRSIEIPDSVTSIKGGTFESCSSLSSIKIPDSVTSIGSGAFQNCSSLSSIKIPDSVTSIGSGAFQNCSILSSIEIPDSVTSIGDSAFWNCSSLSSIEIPNSVKSIDDYAFGGCTKLTNVYILGNPNISTSKNNTLNGNKEKPTTIYYWSSASNVENYLNLKKCKGYYTKGKLFDLSVDNEKDKTAEYGTDKVEYTATVGGLVSALNTVTIASFSVTGKSTKDSTSVDSSVIEVKSYDPDTKKLVISIRPGKTLDALEDNYKYTFDVNIKGEFSGEQFEDKCEDAMSLAVTKKTSGNADIKSEKTISNEGGTTSFKIDAPVYGGEYDTDAKISVQSADSGFDGIVNCENSSIKKSADNSYTLFLKTENVDSGHLTTNGNIKIKIPVKESTNCDAYNMFLTVKVKGSPEAVAKDNIDAATDSITIKNTDTSCEYNIKKLGEAEYAAEKWQRGTGVGGNVVFADLAPADFYTVAVRYPENGDVKATLPSELLTSTLSAKPAEGEGYEIDYENETITPKDGYEILVDGTVCGESSISIAPDKKYQVERKKKTDNKGNTIPASMPTDITIPLRYDAPDTAVNVPEKNNVTDVSIIINDTKKDYEYIVVPEGFSEDDIAKAWKQAKADNTAYTVVNDGDTLKFTKGFKKEENDSVVSDDLKPSTSYKIIVRKKANKDENKFASTSVASDTVTTKGSQTPPDGDVVNGTTDNSKNTSSTVVANGKAGHEYILVPKGTDASAVTEEQWKSNGQKPDSDGEITFDRTYNAKSKDDKNIQPGTEYEILVRKPGDDDKMPSESKKSDVTYTKQVTPDLEKDNILNNAENGISIDYAKETVTVNGDEYEVYVPADGTTVPGQNTPATISGDKQSSSIEPAVNGDRKIYVRKKALTKEDGVTIPASEWLAVEVKKIEQHKHDFGATASNPEGWEIVKAATCEENGLKKRTCKECGYSETQEIPALGHDFDETNENAKFVWKPVTDSAGKVSGYTAELYVICKRDASHVENAGTVSVTATVKDATEEAEGSITYTARKTYNGKEYSAVRVSTLSKLTKLVDSSQTNAQSGIYVSVSRPDDAPVTKMDGVDLELVKSLMSESEMENYNDKSVSTQVTLYLEVQNLGEVISSDDKAKIQEKVESLVEAVKGSDTEDVKTGAEYLDLSMYKKIMTKKDDGIEQAVTSQITNTGKNITVSVEIPQSMKDVESGYTRTYHVIRVHGSEVSILDTKQSGDTLSFETDSFSSYAITYVGVKKNGGGTPSTPEQKPTKVTVNPTQAILTSKGSTTQLTATVEPSNATNKNVAWKSSDTSVATVDENGLVTAVANGTATITVMTEEGGLTATATITVKISSGGNSGGTTPEQKPTKVTVNPAQATLTSKGSTTQLTATVEPSNAANKKVTWKSSDTSVAIVDANGLVTAVANGTVTITVTTVEGGLTASATITVKISSGDNGNSDNNNNNNDNNNNNNSSSDNNNGNNSNDNSSAALPDSKKESQSVTSPKTGDDFNMGLWTTLLIASAAGLLALFGRRKKKS